VNPLLALLNRLHITPKRQHRVQPKAKGLLLRENAILLIRHPQEGVWRLPGGFVRDDESAFEAATRSIHQLTGLRPSILQPIARVDESEFRADASFGDFFQMYSTLFWVADWQESAPAHPSEWQHQFIPLAALPANCHPEVLQAVQAWQQFNQHGQLKVL